MSGSAALSVRGLSKSFGATTVLAGIDVEVAAGEVLALLGPSGCGKTTLLRLVAGLERPDVGEVWLGGEPVSSSSAFVPAEQRLVGMVFQEGALFPHLSVARNVGFGLDRPDRRAGPRIEEMLELVGLEGFSDRSPDSLSGGQRQRVALARALAPGPRVLLMDEPFSNLDALLRSRLRREVRDLLAATGVTTVFVTHDRDEAFSLADRVAVMRDGVLAQVDEPRRVFERPSTRWLASFVGDANFLVGTVVGAGASGRTKVSTALGTMEVALPDTMSAVPVEGTRVEVLVRPDDLALSGPAMLPAVLPAGSVEPSVAATVVDLEYVGEFTTITVRLADGPSLGIRLRSSTVGVDVGDDVLVERIPGRGAPVAYPQL